MPQTSSISLSLSHLVARGAGVTRRMDVGWLSRPFSRAGQRPPLVACILEGRPFPGEPADISGKERAALWLHGAYLDGSLRREQERLRVRLKRMNTTTIVYFMTPLSFPGLIVENAFNPLWLVIAVTGSLLSSFALANWFSGRTNSVRMSIDALSSLVWTADLVEHARVRAMRCGDAGPIAELGYAARNKEWPGIRCLESLSVGDRVSLMRLTERLHNLENTKSMPVLDGETKELIGRAISVLEEST